MKTLKKNFKDYFAFSKSERRGIFVLLILLLLIIIINTALPLYITKGKSDFSAFESIVNDFEKTKEVVNKKSYHNFSKEKNFDFNNSDRSVVEKTITPFTFDPNNLPDDKWKELGMTDKQIKVIKNFESKGGKFYKKEDLKKLYCISQNEYEILEPYIQISSQRFENSPFKEYKKTQTVILEVNTATEEDLEKLKGIGQYLSKSIIKYRELLGGFYKAEQLLEVYHLDSVKYALIKPQISIDAQYTRKIDVNTAEFDVLKKHPYIGYNVALSLTNYRKVHGKFKKLPEIKKSALITDALYQKISPYLKVE